MTPVFLTDETIARIEEVLRREEQLNGPVKSQAEALGLVKMRLWEVMDAMEKRDDQMVHDKMLEAAVECIRWAQELKERMA